MPRCVSVHTCEAVQDTVDIFGIRIARLTPDEALRRIHALAQRGKPALVAYANAHTLNLAAEDRELKDVLTQCDVVLNDGAGVQLAARLRGAPFPANLNGTDFTPRVLALAAENGWPVYFLGGKPGVAERAAAKLAQRYPGLDIAGTKDGYFDKQKSAEVADEIRRSGAQLLIVALGNPLQEKWLKENLEATGVRLGIGVGAFLDFTAGMVPRAPRWMNKLGVEWLYRLAQEPRRLWRRYVLGNPLFVARAIRYALTAG